MKPSKYDDKARELFQACDHLDPETQIKFIAQALAEARADGIREVAAYVTGRHNALVNSCDGAAIGGVIALPDGAAKPDAG